MTISDLFQPADEQLDEDVSIGGCASLWMSFASLAFAQTEMGPAERAAQEAPAPPLPSSPPVHLGERGQWLMMGGNLVTRVPPGK